MSSHKRKASRVLESLAPLKSTPATSTKGKGKAAPSPEARALADLKFPASFNFRFQKGENDDQPASAPVRTSPTDKENRNAAASLLHKIAHAQTETDATHSQQDIKDAMNELPSTPTPRTSTPPPKITINYASPSPARRADTTTNTKTAATQAAKINDRHITITIPELFASPLATTDRSDCRPTYGILHPMSKRRSQELLMQRWMESEDGKNETEELKKAGKGSKAKEKDGARNAASEAEVESTDLVGGEEEGNEEEGDVEEQEVEAGVDEQQVEADIEGAKGADAE